MHIRTAEMDTVELRLLKIIFVFFNWKRMHKPYRSFILYFMWMFCACLAQSSAASICGSRDHMGNMWMEINPVGKRKRNLDRDQRLASFHSFLPLFFIPSKFGILWDFCLIPEERVNLNQIWDFLSPFFFKSMWFDLLSHDLDHWILNC